MWAFEVRTKRREQWCELKGGKRRQDSGWAIGLMMERLYITGQEARTLRRLSRCVPTLSLVPVETSVIEPMGRRWTKKDTCRLEAIRTILGLPPDRRIELRVPSPSKRIRASCVCSRVCSIELPQGSFLRLTASDESIVRLPSDVEVLVDSPQLSFATVSQQLNDLVRRSVMRPYEADIRLVAMAAEECGSYAFDPWHPRTGGCTFFLPALTTTNDLKTYLDDLHGLDGMARAKRALRFAFDRSASPMETFVNAAMSLPSSHGGLFLGRPAANKRIDLTDLQSLMLNHRDHITPDLLWETWAIIIEYLGSEPHEGAQAKDEDMGRIQDYQVLGYLVFPVTYKNVHNPTALNQLAMRVAEAMELKGAAGMRAQVAILQADQEFLERQSDLFKILLPAVQWS